MTREDYRDAETTWRELARRYPKSPWGKVGLARLDMALGRFDAAEALLQETIALHPREFGPKAALGDLHLLIGRWEDALLVWDELWQSYPDVVWTYVGRARALAKLGRTQGALAIIVEGRERLPDHAPALREIEFEILADGEPRPGAGVAQAGLSEPLTFADDPGSKVHIYTVTFLDMEGRKVYPGGAERYIFDLIEIFAARGLECVIYQAGVTNWVRQVNGIRVEAFPWQGDLLSLSVQFGTLTRPGVLNIYSPFSLAVSSRHNPSIGVCHGVYWDWPGSTILSDNVARDVFSALLHLDQVVSVDANSINAVRATRPDLAGRMSYLPNYVGPEFFDRKKPSYAKGRARVLYPRRLYTARGYWLLAEAIPDLLKTFPDVRIAFVGDADPAERDHANQLVRDYPDNVSFRAAHPDEMAQFYRWADISVIPTVHSEGTSLSALEALASGNALIATNVGGLSNIIIDELNGLLIEPTRAALTAALRRLIEDPALGDSLRAGGVATAHAFRKERWVKAWNDVVTPILGRPALTFPRPAPGPRAIRRIVHPRTGGIVFDLNDHAAGLPRQRPHHLLTALHKLGADVTVVSDEPQTSPLARHGGSWEVLGRDAQIHDTNAVIFIYYAFHVWALGAVGEAWLATLGKDERAVFDSTRDHHVLPGALVWFDLIDEPGLHGNPRYGEAVELFIRHAHLVTTTSRVLHGRYAKARPDMVLVENACWPDDFEPSHIAAGEPETSPLGLLVQAHRAAGSRIIGYVGAVAPWFDFALVERLAGDFPADQIIIVGPIADAARADCARLAELPNVSLHGHVGYGTLPALVTLFDVAIIPFRINAITNATNPLKLYEYLSAGLPVVATDMAELRAIKSAGAVPGLLLAAGGDAFSRCVSEVIDEPSGMRSIRGQARAFAVGNSWLARGATTMAALNGLGFRHGAPNTDDAGVSAFAVSHNTLAPARAVRVSHGKGLQPWICLAGDAIATGDTATLLVPLFAPEKGIYRLDLWVTRSPAGFVSGQVSHVVRFNGQELTRYDLGSSHLTTRIVAVVECEAGIQNLYLDVVALRPMITRINEDAAIRLRRLSLRRWRDMKPQVVVHGPPAPVAAAAAVSKRMPSAPISPPPTAAGSVINGSVINGSAVPRPGVPRSDAPRPGVPASGVAGPATAVRGSSARVIATPAARAPGTAEPPARHRTG